eukprot:TRINITY_DN23746_c1_g1_i6.p1 TRINITY_DN23746_c1_g1~~TRINITY_DN23746_c1_g1_i6.p1  ORF type:complete len:301 (+),score=-29.20 TRINITY_DN23746_c1_g1_i6:351-1253(+)
MFLTYRVYIQQCQVQQNQVQCTYFVQYFKLYLVLKFLKQQNKFVLLIKTNNNQRKQQIFSTPQKFETSLVIKYRIQQNLSNPEQTKLHKSSVTYSCGIGILQNLLKKPFFNTQIIGFYGIQCSLDNKNPHNKKINSDQKISKNLQGSKIREITKKQVMVFLRKFSGSCKASLTFVHLFCHNPRCFSSLSRILLHLRCKNFLMYAFIYFFILIQGSKIIFKNGLDIINFSLGKYLVSETCAIILHTNYQSTQQFTHKFILIEKIILLPNLNICCSYLKQIVCLKNRYLQSQLFSLKNLDQI